MNDSRPAVDCSMTTWDGAALYYRAWLPAVAASKALVLFHRGHEHSGRWQHVVDALALDDVAIFAWDARGHGRSSGERGAAESVAALVKEAFQHPFGVGRHPPADQPGRRDRHPARRR